MKNQNVNPPTKEEGLEIVSPIHPEVTNALNHGAMKAANYFATERTRVDRSVQSMLVRYHAKLHLEKKFPSAVVLDNLSLCGLSMLCKNLKWKSRPVSCRLRLWKSADGTLPTPGDSREKRIYYTQPMLPFPSDGSNPDGKEELKFAILWNLSSRGILMPLSLVCPKRIIDYKTGETEVWWQIDIPDPAAGIKGTGETPAGPREDLDISARRKKKEQDE